VTLALKNVVLPLDRFTLTVDLEISRGVTVLFGPSGAGKTSLLDIVAGLRQPASAWIQLGQQLLTDTARGLRVPPRRRGIGYLPQDLALFPHRSVHGNLLYGHRAGGDDRFQLAPIVELLELQPLLQRRAVDLSGGEKQRVALGRALLSSPRLLLLDEPLASLDLPLKARILPYLSRIRDEFDLPMLYVTHDRYETLAIAERMVVMVNGRVAQTGTVEELFSRPQSLAVAGILTVETILPGRIENRVEDLVTVRVGVGAGRGAVLLSAVDSGLPKGAHEVHVCIRAEDVILMRGPDAPSSARNHLTATVTGVTREGPMVRIDLDCGVRLAALLTRQACEELGLEMGTQVVALVKAPNVHLIPR